MARVGAVALLAISLATRPPELPLALAAEVLAGGGVLDRLRVSAEQRRRLAGGEVVSYAVDESSERELAVGLVLFVPAPVSELAQYLEAGRLIADDPDLSAHGAIPEPDAFGALSAVVFSGGERAEAESLLDATPGSRFNLSRAEIEALRALRRAPAADRVRAPETAAAGYRKLLHQRWQAYRQGGLAGVAPYARSGEGSTDAAAELRLLTPETDRLFPQGAELREAFLRYPTAQPPEAVSRFYWMKRQVQRRPTLSLLHLVVLRRADLVLHGELYFYVGHSYNVAHIVTGAAAYQDGALLFTTSRFSTDEVLGVGNQMKRGVGRVQLRDETRKRLERVRASLIRPPSVQSP